MQEDTCKDTCIFLSFEHLMQIKYVSTSLREFSGQSKETSKRLKTWETLPNIKPQKTSGDIISLFIR